LPAQPGRYTCTATAPNAAKRFGARHASTDVIAPPSDMPVEYTRAVLSTQNVASMWSSNAIAMLTSFWRPFSPVRLKWRFEPVFCPSGATIRKSLRRASGSKFP